MPLGWGKGDLAETREGHCCSQNFQRFTKNKRWLPASNETALTFFRGSPQKMPLTNA